MKYIRQYGSPIASTFNAQVKVTVQPSFEPVTTQEAKDHLRVTFNDDDAEIATMVTAARLRVEGLSGMKLATQTVDIVADNWEALADPNSIEVLRLMVGPVTAINSVKYYDAEDSDTTMPSTDYWTDLVSLPARVQVKTSWPTINERIGNIRINCTVGYANANSVPAVFKQAIKLLVGHYYENREQVTDLKLMPVPDGVYHLVQSHPEFHHHATGSI